MSKQNNENKKEDENLSKRLDAIIRLLIENNKQNLGNKFNLGETIRNLNSIGLTPSEIAKILGKKSYSDISPHLYKKKKETKGSSIELLSEE